MTGADAGPGTFLWTEDGTGYGARRWDGHRKEEEQGEVQEEEQCEEQGEEQEEEQGEEQGEEQEEKQGEEERNEEGYGPPTLQPRLVLEIQEQVLQSLH